MHAHVVLYTDGGARGNPGPSAIGVVIKTPAGKELEAFGKMVGSGTNNQAEYQALLAGLKRAQSLGATAVECYLDSELVVKQLRGEYKVKEAGLKDRYKEVKLLADQFEQIVFRHVRRSQNARADALVNQALDEQLVTR